MQRLQSIRFFNYGSMSSYRIMLLGAPGAGKGTYASRIAPKFNIPAISTGDLVRHEISLQTSLGSTLKEYSNRGLLVPDALIMEMIKKRLQENDAQKGYVLDGFPRNLDQAFEFDKVAELNLVINLSLPEWILIDKICGRRVCAECGAGYNVAYIHEDGYDMPPLLPKLKGVCDHCGSTALIQRSDDKASIVQERLRVYYDETEPLIKYYQEKGNLKNFEIKRGLGDLDNLMHLLKSELGSG